MEHIIKNLLVADNDVITKATQDLQEAFKSPESIPALCDIVVSSSDPQIRQYSAVLLRKRLGKLRNWLLVPETQRQVIKQGMLNALINEPEKSVRNSIAQFVGVLVKHEFAKNDSWMTEVLKFIFDHCQSSDPKLSELGSSVFAVLTDIAPDQFIPHMESICQMFTAAMLHTEASGNMVNPVLFNILMGMSHLVPFTVGHNSAENTYQGSVPYVIKALQGFAIHDPEKFVEAFDILDNLADNSVKVLTPHVQLLIEFCLDIGRNVNCEDGVRVKAIAFVGYLVRLKKKSIIKLKLVEPITQVLFNLMAAEPEIEDEEEEYYADNAELTSPMSCATQTMDLLALHVAPEKLIPPLLALLDPALKGTDPLQKKASYLCMAVIAEGCSETISSKYLRPLLDSIKAGITDSNSIVRNAALFALGQFSEHLQPEISQYANEILPILFEFLQQVCGQIKSTGKEPKHIDRLFYAMETFCENLEDALTPHLPILMERLFDALDWNNSVHLRELALSSVQSAATASKSGMLPFFPLLIEGLKQYLIKTDNEDIITLRPTAIDTLASLARTIGKENFLPLAADTMNLGLTLIEDADDPDLRRSCYNLFASMSEVIGIEIGSALPKIVEKMLTSVKSTEGILPEYKDDETALDIYDNHADENDDQEYDIENSDEEDDDDDIAGYSVENAYLDEKEEAIIALKELANYSGPAFAPFIQPSFEEIYKLINYPNEDIRKASIEALTQFVVSLHELQNPEGVKQTLLVLIPKFSEIIRTDEERTVVMAALDGYGEVLGKLKTEALQIDLQRNAVFGCILDVLNGKVSCQFSEVVDDDVEESEYDEAIIETAGDILPRFGNAIPPQEFQLYFGRVWQVLVSKVEKSKKSEDANSQRAFAIGVISECFKPLKEYSATWVPQLLPILLDGVKDSCEQVRNNAVFGLGEMVINADEATFGHYPIILSALSDAVSKEQHAGTLDNICGALARLIITNSTLVPLQQVLPVFIKYLPLREDFEENYAVYRSLQHLYTKGEDQLKPHIDQIIQLGLQVLFQKQYNSDEARDFIFNFLKQIRQDFADQFASVVSSITIPEFAQFVSSL